MRCFIVLLLILQTSVMAEAARLLDEILASGYLNVGTTGDYAPLTFFDTQGTLEGLAIQVAKNFGDNLGVHVNFVLTTWPTLTSDLLAGKFDIAMGGISATPSRASKFLLSRKILDSGKVAICHCAVADRLIDLPSIDQSWVRVVVNPGGTNEAFVNENIKKAQILRVNNNHAPFEYMLSNKADAMITDLIEAEYQSAQHAGELCVCTKIFPGTEHGKVYLLPKTSQELLNRLDSWLAEQNLMMLAYNWGITDQ